MRVDDAHTAVAAEEGHRRGEGRPVGEEGDAVEGEEEEKEEEKGKK